jgi:hypothetical protein
MLSWTPGPSLNQLLARNEKSRELNLGLLVMLMLRLNTGGLMLSTLGQFSGWNWMSRSSTTCSACRPKRRWQSQLLLMSCHCSAPSQSCSQFHHAKTDCIIVVFCAAHKLQLQHTLLPRTLMSLAIINLPTNTKTNYDQPAGL